MEIIYGKTVFSWQMKDHLSNNFIIYLNGKGNNNIWPMTKGCDVEKKYRY